MKDVKTFVFFRTNLPYNSCHWFTVKVLTFQIIRQTMSPEEIVTGGACNTIEGSFRHSHGLHPPLHIRNPDRCTPGNVESFSKVFLDYIVAIVDGKLKPRW